MKGLLPPWTSLEAYNPCPGTQAPTPFLAITLLILLNSGRVPLEYRNRLVTNVGLAVSVIPYIVVGVQEVLGSL